MKTELEKIGQRIQTLIKQHPYYKRDHIAQALGVGVGAVGRYIRGEADAGAIGLKKIAEMFNVSLEWLITGRAPVSSDIVKDNPAQYPHYKSMSPADQEILDIIQLMAPNTKDMAKMVLMSMVQYQVRQNYWPDTIDNKKTED